MEIFAYIVSEILIHGFQNVSFRFTHARGFILGFNRTWEAVRIPKRIESFLTRKASFVCVSTDSLFWTKPLFFLSLSTCRCPDSEKARKQISNDSLSLFDEKSFWSSKR